MLLSLARQTTVTHQSTSSRRHLAPMRLQQVRTRRMRPSRRRIPLTRLLLTWNPQLRANIHRPTSDLVASSRTPTLRFPPCSSRTRKARMPRLQRHLQKPIWRPRRQGYMPCSNLWTRMAVARSLAKSLQPSSEPTVNSKLFLASQMLRPFHRCFGPCGSSKRQASSTKIAIRTLRARSSSRVCWPTGQGLPTRQQNGAAARIEQMRLIASPMHCRSLPRKKMKRSFTLVGTRTMSPSWTMRTRAL